MFDTDIRNGVRCVLAPLHKSIVLTLCESAQADKKDMIESICDVASCNDNVSVEVIADETKDSGIPTLGILVDGSDCGITFSTAPKGNLLSPFLYAILNAAGSCFTLDKELLDRVSKITTPVELVTYIGRHSSITPRTLQIINEIVAVNPLITNRIEDASTGKEDIRRFGIVTLPTVLCNDAVLCDGWNSPEDIVRAIEHLAA